MATVRVTHAPRAGAQAAHKKKARPGPGSSCQERQLARLLLRVFLCLGFRRGCGRRRRFGVFRVGFGFLVGGGFVCAGLLVGGALLCSRLLVGRSFFLLRLLVGGGFFGLGLLVGCALRRSGLFR